MEFYLLTVEFVANCSELKNMEKSFFLFGFYFVFLHIPVMRCPELGFSSP